MQYDALIDGFVSGMQKEASKWKEMILGGRLSGAAKDKLLKKYVDPEKMIAGLNTGSDNIIKRYGVNVERSSLWNRLKEVVNRTLHPDYLSPYVTSYDTRNMLLPKGWAYNHLPSFISGNPIAIKHRSSSFIPNRYLDALLKRHEVDEVLVGRKCWLSILRILKAGNLANVPCMSRQRSWRASQSM